MGMTKSPKMIRFSFAVDDCSSPILSEIERIEDETGIEHSVTSWNAYRERVASMYADIFKALCGAGGKDAFHAPSLSLADPNNSDEMLFTASMPEAHYRKWWKALFTGTMPMPVKAAIYQEASEHLTARSGFIPFYSPEVRSWPNIEDQPPRLRGIFVKGFLNALWASGRADETFFDTLLEDARYILEESLTAQGIVDEFIEYPEGSEE